MAKKRFSITTDEQLKADAEALFERLGLNLSTAVNIFLHKVVAEGGMPFHITLPSESTEKMHVYPAIFRKDEGGGYWVEFPDLPGCVTDGETLEEAFLMAGDALNCWFSTDEKEPTATPISEIKVENGAIVQLVCASEYVSEETKKYLAEEFRKGK